MDKSPSNKIKELLKTEESFCVRDSPGIIRWGTKEQTTEPSEYGIVVIERLI